MRKIGVKLKFSLKSNVHVWNLTFLHFSFYFITVRLELMISFLKKVFNFSIRNFNSASIFSICNFCGSPNFSPVAYVALAFLAFHRISWKRFPGISIKYFSIASLMGVFSDFHLLSLKTVGQPNPTTVSFWMFNLLRIKAVIQEFPIRATRWWCCSPSD